MTNGKKILIIGGSGFVGANLVPGLFAEGHGVTLLNRGNTPMQGTMQLSADRENHAQMEAVCQSICDMDVVIDTSSYKGSHTALAWSLLSTKTHHWIHLGSAAVYKELGGRHPRETDPIGGAAIWAEYGAEKTEVDQFLIENAGNLPITILRPPYLYGPKNDNDRETFVWSRVLQGRPVVVPGDGTTNIQFLHIEDLVRIIVSAINIRPEGCRVYNVASDERPSLSQWVAAVAAAAGAKDPGVLAEDQAQDFKPRQFFPFRDYPCCVDVGPVKADLKWTAKYGISDGFRQTYATYDQEELKKRRLDTIVEDIILNRLRKPASLRL